MIYFSLIFTLLLTQIIGNLPASNCFPYAGEIGLGYDYFRSLPEGDWEGNTGGLAEFNLGFSAPYLDDFGMGAQLGGSYGNYDWSGRGSSPAERQTSSQQQVFLTGALFKKTQCCSGINMGLAYDWMWNKNASVFALQSSLSQLRFQGGYLFNYSDEFGLWGTLDVHTSHRESEGIPVSFRAISQANVYWEHLFENCSRTMLWAGIPYKKSLMFPTGRAGRFIIGAQFHAPLTQSLSIDGHACYMRGHSALGALKERTYVANLCIELKWTFGDQDKCAQPYMLIGNNSNFLTDTNISF